MRQLVVKAQENGQSYPAVKQELLGSLSGSEVEDLNSDGRPELVLFVTSAGSGSYGSVLAWSASKGHTLLPITMPDLSGKLAQGYMGHDQFNVVETTLVRRSRSIARATRMPSPQAAPARSTTKWCLLRQGSSSSQ